MKPNLAIIGAGNLAWHLAPALDNAGFGVSEVYSRERLHAAALTRRLYQAEVRSTLDFSDSTANVFLVTVADDALQQVVRELVLPEGAVLVHTSGSQLLQVLSDAAAASIGVFYPLQTFTKEKKGVDFRNIPIFYEGSDAASEELLSDMGNAISSHVVKMSSAQRRGLHVAAVFASNFSNYMMTLAAGILKDEQVSFEYLKPLIVETINKAIAIGPDEGQTGPARRGDLEILDQHLEYLQDNPKLAEIYRLLSQQIIDHYHVSE